MLRTLASATILTVAMLGLTACGDDDSGGGGATHDARDDRRDVRR